MNMPCSTEPARQKKVTVEVCPDDVEIILPYSASNESLRRRQTSDPRKILTEEGNRTRKRRLASVQENCEGCESASDCLSDGLKEENELFQKGDIEGERLFSFAPSTPRRKKPCPSSTQKSGAPSATKITPKNRTPISGKKAVQTPSKSSCTPRSSRKRLDEDFEKVDKKNTSPKHEAYVPKTPYSMRTRLVQKIHKEVSKDDMEYEDSSSEYSLSDSDDNSDDSSDSSSSDEKHSEVKKPTMPLPSTPARRTAPKYLDLRYVCSAKDYFQQKSSKKKDKTSNNILNQLKNPNLTHAQFRAILKQLSQPHKKEIQSLNDNLCYQFEQWMFFLSQNFSVILYGLGSKKKILESFRKHCLSESKVIVVNGFFPSITLKEILDSIMKQLLNMKEAASSSAVELIKERLNSKSAPHIFLIINNIDGSCLRDEKCQSALCSLVSHEKIHLIASIDHLNAPLIWDVGKLGNLSPVWIEATTFLPYVDEVSFENSFLVKQAGSSMALSSLVNVYKSLTKNAKKIYCILVEDYLDNCKSKKNYSGMSFIKLYDTAKRDFIVSSDLSLRTLLTEFVDHELVKWRRDNEHLTIPVEVSVLKKFMEMHKHSV